MVRVSSRLAANFRQGWSRNSSMRLRQGGSRMAARAVVEGIRKASITLARTMPRVIRRVVAPIRRRTRKVSRLASPDWRMAPARMKPPRSRKTTEEPKGWSRSLREARCRREAKGITRRVVTARGRASVRNRMKMKRKRARVFWPAGVSPSRGRNPAARASRRPSGMP